MHAFIEKEKTYLIFRNMKKITSQFLGLANKNDFDAMQGSSKLRLKNNLNRFKLCSTSKNLRNNSTSKKALLFHCK